jgi:hypothetical protein
VLIQDRRIFRLDNTRDQIDVLTGYWQPEGETITLKQIVQNFLKKTGTIGFKNSPVVQLRHGPEISQMDIANLVPGTIVCGTGQGTFSSTDVVIDGASITSAVELNNCFTTCYNNIVAANTGTTTDPVFSMLDGSVGYITHDADIASLTINDMPQNSMFTLFRDQDNSTTAHGLTLTSDFVLTNGSTWTYLPYARDVIYISTYDAGTTKIISNVYDFGTPGS